MKSTIIMLFFCFLGFSQNFEEIKKQALLDNKNIILVFSGSDWCAPCIKLDKTILQSDAFQNECQKSWLFYKADFPKRAKIAEEIKKENALLAEKYNAEGNFPLVVLLNPEGKILGKMGFKKVAPEEYIQELHAFEK